MPLNRPNQRSSNRVQPKTDQQIRNALPPNPLPDPARIALEEYLSSVQSMWKRIRTLLQWLPPDRILPRSPRSSGQFFKKHPLEKFAKPCKQEGAWEIRWLLLALLTIGVMVLYQSLASLGSDRSSGLEPGQALAEQGSFSPGVDPFDSKDPTTAVLYPIVLPDRLEVLLSLKDQPLQHYSVPHSQMEWESLIHALLLSLRRTSFLQERLPLLQEAYDWLIRPAEPVLVQQSIKTLVFVLDGSLRNLPLAALHDGHHYLIENYAIALTPNLTLLEAKAQLPKHPKTLVAGISQAIQGFTALPSVTQEINQISRWLGGKRLLNQNFTKANLQKYLQKESYSIVHIATHGQFSSNPEQTFILTWDGKVTLLELEAFLKQRSAYQLVPLDLLVLSACQTATGDDRAILGLAGLTVETAVRTALATLWAVQDESTAQLMIQFYRHWAEPGTTKAEALRQAQLSLLQGKYNHPFFWAAFVLVGNWR